MKRIVVALVMLAASALPPGCAPASADAVDTRYCGIENIKRDADGRIARSSAVTRAFRSVYPCPSTGSTSGACPGWQMNHTIPLACGGCDALSNLDWMPVTIKTCADDDCRDRWELRVYCPAPRGMAIR